MLKLKLQYFGHLMWRADSSEKTLMWERLRAGGEGNERGWDGWMASPTQWTWVWVNSGSWWWTGRPGVLRFMGSQSRTWLSDWTELPCLWNKDLTLTFNTLHVWVPTVVSATTLTSHFHYFFDHIMYIYIQIFWGCGLKLLLIVTLEY